jgi:hypothetical protein
MIMAQQPNKDTGARQPQPSQPSQPSSQPKTGSNSPNQSSGANQQSRGAGGSPSSTGGGANRQGAGAPSGGSSSQKSGQSSQRDERGQQSEGKPQRTDAQKRSPNFDDSPDRSGKGGDANTSIEGGSGGGSRQRGNLPQYGDTVPGDPRRQHVEAEGREGSTDSDSEAMGTE